MSDTPADTLVPPFVIRSRRFIDLSLSPEQYFASTVPNMPRVRTSLRLSFVGEDPEIWVGSSVVLGRVSRVCGFGCWMGWSGCCRRDRIGCRMPLGQNRLQDSVAVKNLDHKKRHNHKGKNKTRKNNTRKKRKRKNTRTKNEKKKDNIKNNKNKNKEHWKHWNRATPRVG